MPKQERLNEKAISAFTNAIKGILITARNWRDKREVDSRKSSIKPSTPLIRIQLPDPLMIQLPDPSMIRIQLPVPIILD